jgi:pimeloyl-ACP methyl ester carboxylesterase
MAHIPTSTSRSSRPWLRRLRRWAIILSSIALGWVLLLYLMQGSLIFPRSVAGFGPRPSTIPEATIITLARADGTMIRAAYLPPARRANNAMTVPATDTSAARYPAAIWFHGNAERIENLANLEHVLFYHDLGYALLMPEYRGFGLSDGTPSQAGILADNIALHAWLVRQPEVDPARIVYHGLSLGGGVAIDLARTHPPAALVLESTFTSIIDHARRFLIPGPVARLIVRHPFDNLAVIGTLTMPMLIVHGVQDQVTPIAHARALRDAAPHARYAEFEADHFTLARHASAITALIARTLADAGLPVDPAALSPTAPAPIAPAGPSPATPPPSPAPAPGPRPGQSRGRRSPGRAVRRCPRGATAPVARA